MLESPDENNEQTHVFLEFDSDLHHESCLSDRIFVIDVYMLMKHGKRRTTKEAWPRPIYVDCLVFKR